MFQWLSTATGLSIDFLAFTTAGISLGAGLAIGWKIIAPFFPVKDGPTSNLEPEDT